MKRMFAGLAAALVFAAGLGAQELVTLTTPIAKASATNCRLQALLLEPIAGRISADVLLDNGDHVLKVYNADTAPSGATLLHNLNTGNFSVTSLIKAVYNRLIADGVCVGTVAGTPQ